MKKLRIIIFKVEHGFCSFIKTPNNYTILIDCGATESFSPIKYILDNELNDVSLYNNRKLTRFILTHPHDDHLTDIERLKNELPPAIILRQKYVWGDVKVSEDGDYEKLDTYVELQEIYNTPIVNPPDWGMDLGHGAYFSPEEAKKIDANKFINNSSIPTILKYSNFKIIFPGDLEKAAWLELLKKQNFKEGIKGGSFFVASHHGHSSGYCKEIFDAMGKPYFNIISTHSGDDSVEKAYSSSDLAIGVDYDGQKRYMFSTRCDGNLLIEIEENGRCTFEFLELEDNIDKEKTPSIFSLWDPITLR